MMIAEGKIMNQNDSKTHPYQIIRLSTCHLQEVIQCQNEIYQLMSNKQSYFPLDINEVESMIEDDGLIFGLYVYGLLKGFSVMFFPGQSPDNIARDLYSQDIDFNQTFHLEAVMIHPDYRGNHLQRTLFLHMLDYLKKNTEYRFVYSTVSPENIPSLKSLLSINLVIRGLKKKYDQSKRYILFQDIKDPIQIIHSDVKVIDIMDESSQLIQFKNDYVGFMFTQDDERQYISFGKMKSGR